MRTRGLSRRCYAVGCFPMVYDRPGCLRDIWGRGLVEGVEFRGSAAPLHSRFSLCLPQYRCATNMFRRARNEAGVAVVCCGGLVGCGCHCVHTCASLCIVVPAYSRISPALGCYRCASSFGMRAAGLYVRIYPCTRGDNYFCDSHDRDLRATRRILPPLSRRLPFGLYCVAGCPSTCRI